MSEKKSSIDEDLLRTALVIARSWRVVVFVPLLCMLVSGALILSRPRDIPFAFARVVAEPSQIALLREPEWVRRQLATQNGTAPDEEAVAAVDQLLVRPEPDGVYKLEMTDGVPARALDLVGALVDGLVQEPTILPVVEPSRRDITLEKLEQALVTVEGNGEERAQLADALVTAMSYILSLPPPAKAPRVANSVLVVEAARLSSPPDPRRDILVVLLVGFGSAAVLITLVLLWSWVSAVMAKPENVESVGAIRKVLPSFRRARRD